MSLLLSIFTLIKPEIWMESRLESQSKVIPLKCKIWICNVSCIMEEPNSDRVCLDSKQPWNLDGFSSTIAVSSLFFEVQGLDCNVICSLEKSNYFNRVLLTEWRHQEVNGGACDVENQKVAMARPSRVTSWPRVLAPSYYLRRPHRLLFLCLLFMCFTYLIWDRRSLVVQQQVLYQPLTAMFCLSHIILLLSWF